MNCNPSFLLSESRCFQGCLDQPDLDRIELWLWATHAGVSTDAQILIQNSLCFRGCVSAGLGQAIVVYLLARIAGFSTEAGYLFNAAACMNCLTSEQALAVNPYIVAETTRQSSDIATLLESSKCLAGCVGSRDAYLAAKIAVLVGLEGSGLTPAELALNASCLSCLDYPQLKMIETWILCNSWNPSSESGLLAWYKSDAGVTLSGASVTGWADQSGNGHHLTGAAARYPTRVASQLNGLPSIRFDGVSQYLTSGAFTMSQPLTIYILARQISYTQNRRILSGVTDGFLYQSNTVAPNVSMRTGGSVGSTYTAWAVGSFASLFSAWDGVSSKLWQNRGRTFGGNPGAGNFGGLVLAATNLFALAGNAEFVEIVVRSGVDTALLQNLHNNYLMVRGGFSFNSLIAEGDSLTAGAGLSESDLYPVKFITAKSPVLWGYFNSAVGGTHISDMFSRESIVDESLNSRLDSNWITILAGHNDLADSVNTPAQVFELIKTYCMDRRRVGFKVGVCTLLPSTKVGFNTKRNEVNAMIVAEHSFADALIRLDLNPDIGPDAAANNATYYSDGTHLTAAGQTKYANVVVASLP